jgi:hypothetical protein
MLMRMQSRISTREQVKTAPPNKTEKKKPRSLRNAARSKARE